ncbi:MAG: O-antigen ligase family protein [Candidatus Gracilibacteria bacterium]|nr:O-antigen ligase family protein [Candidatus Gracilibacteria bacterium]
MKKLLIIFTALLPFHALMINFLKCKIGVGENIMNIARFWKEFIIIGLTIGVLFNLYKRYKLNLNKALKNNYLVGTTLTFIIISFAYIFLPYFDVNLANILGFKYDVFFLLALIAGLYLVSARENFNLLLKTVFFSIALMIVIFLPIYLSGHIEIMTTLFGYSSEVSTYKANACTAFAQNVNGHARFQGTLGGPIRFSVFLTVFFFVYLGYILDYLKNKKSAINYSLYIGLPTLVYLVSIFYAYTKTSLLGFLLGAILFVLIAFRDKLKQIPKKIYLGGGALFIGALGSLVWIKRDLFLHIGSTLNRVENLEHSFHMWRYNPVGYGLGIAGPASVVEQRFWPENWFIQILLEQSFVGLAFFIGVLSIIGVYLWRIIKKRKDYLSVGIFVAFISLLIMANLTHAFEEAATSYTLFLLIGAFIARNLKFSKY